MTEQGLNDCITRVELCAEDLQAIQEEVSGVHARWCDFPAERTHLRQHMLLVLATLKTMTTQYQKAIEQALDEVHNG